MANKITTELDLKSNGFVASLKNVRSSVADADGAFNKFKAGATSSMDAVKANAGAFAVTAGAALVTFGIKALAAFQEVAIAAEDMARATGLSIEEASRWIAVGDDFGITAEQLSSSLGRVVGSLDDEKWQRYGIATRNAYGEAKTANAILLETFGVLERETNATERARMAKELLGKGYQTLAPLIGKTTAELESYLGAVEAGQVITDAEAESARRMALAQDALRDALNEVTLAVGGFVASMGPAIESMAGGVTRIVDMSNKLGVLKDAILGVEFAFSGNPIAAWNTAVGAFTSSTSFASMSLEEMEAALIATGASEAEVILAHEQWAAANQATAATLDGELTPALERAGAAAETFSSRAGSIAAEGAERLASDIDRLKSSLADDAAWQTVLTAMSGLQSGLDSTGEASRAAAQALLAYVEQAEHIPAEKKTEIVALIASGAYAQAAAMLADLTRNRNVSIGVRVYGVAEAQAALGAIGAAGKSLSSSYGVTVPTGGGGGGSGGGGGGGGASAADLAEQMQADWDKITKAMVDQGVWSNEQYLTYLNDRLAGSEQFSDEYNRIWNEINGINEKAVDSQKRLAEAEVKLREDREKAMQKAAEDAAKAAQAAQDEADSRAANAFELGDTSIADYRAYLTQRLGAFDRYSDEYVAIQRQINSLDKQTADAAKADADAEVARQEAIKRLAEEAEAAADKARQRKANESIIAANIAGATYATINTAADPNAVINAIRQYVRNNGPISGIT